MKACSCTARRFIVPQRIVKGGTGSASIVSYPQRSKRAHRDSQNPARIEQKGTSRSSTSVVGVTQVDGKGSATKVRVLQ